MPIDLFQETYKPKDLFATEPKDLFAEPSVLPKTPREQVLSDIDIPKFFKPSAPPISKQLTGKTLVEWAMIPQQRQLDIENYAENVFRKTGKPPNLTKAFFRELPHAFVESFINFVDPNYFQIATVLVAGKGLRELRKIPFFNTPIGRGFFKTMRARLPKLATNEQIMSAMKAGKMDVGAAARARPEIFAQELAKRMPTEAPMKAKVPTVIPKPPVLEIKPTAKIAVPVRKVTPQQIKQAHVIARKKLFISDKGKVKPQYRFLAKQMTGKNSVAKMTQDEAGTFIDALERLPEPTYRAGKLVPPSLPRTELLVGKEFFQRQFRQPTPAKFLTSQSRYAELLGVKPLVKPLEVGKMNLDLEYGQKSQQIDKVSSRLKRFMPTKEMARLLNTYEEAPTELVGKPRETFNYFRDLTREVLVRENEVRASLGLDPIRGRQAYFRHVADKMSDEVLQGKYPLPEGLKYWSEQTVSKKVYNPMEMQRKLRDDLLEKFSDDLPYVMKSMLWTGLKDIHTRIPKNILQKELGVLAKDKAIYPKLTPKEQKIYDAQQVMPASTKKWLTEYVNIVLGGRQTALDESVNLWVTGSPIKSIVNTALRPFGKHIGQRPVTNMITNLSKFPIYGVMGGVRPKQLLRNKFQNIQNLALYGVRNTLKGFLPSSSYPTLDKLLTDSLFKKSYSGFEDMPAQLRGKLERVGLAPYQWTAITNVNQAMKASYHWTADKIQNPARKGLGWADPKRTYSEPKDFFYPSEEARLLKEMEYGAHTTQYGYIGMNMPEVFRYKTLAGLTRLQSWWMNHWFIFQREAATRAFTGEVGYDPNLKVSRDDRLNYLRYLIIGGAILNTLGYERSFLLGTAPSGLPPPAQLMMGLYDYFTNMGDTDWEKRKRAQAGYKIKNSALTFIPGYLAVKDVYTYFKEDKHWTEYLFYKKLDEGETKDIRGIDIPRKRTRTKKAKYY